MIRIALISQDERQTELFQAAFGDHSRQIPKRPYETQEYQLVIQPATHHEELEGLSIDADVIVARGFLAMALQERDYYIPVVEIPINVSDLTRCLNRVEADVVNPRVAVVGSYRVTSPVDDLSSLFGFPLHAFTLHSRHDDVAACMQAAVSSGCNVVVGGKRASELGPKYGLRPFFVESGRDSIWHAIGEAKRVAYISRREKEKSHNLSMVVNQAFDGIVTLSRHGIVTLLNSAAERLLNVRRGIAIGKHCTELLGDSGLSSVLLGTGRLSGEIIEHGGRYLAVNKAPIELADEPLGILVTLQDVTSIQRLETQIRQKIHARGLVARHTFDDILGSSRRILQIVSMARDYAQVDSNVLIIGETGTGKELFAQSIHNVSARNRGPFVAINCAALSETLLESELFGYAPGAFTGAARDGKLGLFELAHKGTIFLDEIAEIPARLQLLLLRVLQEREIMRLGDHRVLPVDVRVIASTNRDLGQLVRAKQFREDLFYRLDILRLPLPTLATRRTDVPLIADHWIGVFAEQFRKSPRMLTDEARNHLRNQDWPGNVRQLRSVCERLVVLSREADIDRSQVEVALASTAGDGDPAALSEPGLAGTSDTDARSPDSHNLSTRERDRILAALQAESYSRIKAAEKLGMGRTTLWRKMRALGIASRHQSKRTAPTESSGGAMG